jgi:O-antigen/teichoic acid export membrane protein
MSTIRRQSIISSLVIYIGFAVGMLNVYFFGTRFTPSQYGLTTIFINIATLMMVFAGLAMPSFIYKFYPYYKDHVEPRKNDLITIGLTVSCIGFLLVMIVGWFFKDLVIRKFGQNSPELLTYYYWIFPMGFGLTIYSILESYSWSIGKPVLTSFLKEVQWRLLTTVLIVLFLVNVIDDFGLFIKLYAFTYPAIALTLFCYLVFTKKIHFTFNFSRLTMRLYKKVITFATFVYSGTIVFTLSQVFDSIVIASKLDDGMAKAGIFGLATIMTSVIQAPQRGIIATSIPHLSRAWKSKDRNRLQKIYQRSSINLLIFASAIFLLIALNFREAIITFGLNSDYLLGFNAFILLGLTRVIDMGTGLNAEILGTSNYWRFQLVSGVLLLIIMLPLTYILAVQYGIIGPAIANLISISIYNLIRILFLYKKFRLFPFTIQSFYTILLAAASYAICHLLFNGLHGFAGLILRSAFFLVIFVSAAIYLKLSPDIAPVLAALKKRFIPGK